MLLSVSSWAWTTMRRLTSCCCCLSLDVGCRAIVEIILQVTSIVYTFVRLGGFQWSMFGNAFVILVDLCLILGSATENWGLIFVFIIFYWLVISGLVALTVVCFILGLAV